MKFLWLILSKYFLVYHATKIYELEVVTDNIRELTEANLCLVNLTSDNRNANKQTEPKLTTNLS